MKVSLGDLEDALMFASPGAGMGIDNSAYLDRETGEIHLAGDLADPELVPDDLEDSDRYLEIPNKYDLDLGKALVFEFVRQKLPEDYDLVRDMFRRSGAYGRFKDFLDNKDLLDDWYSYENEKTIEALRDWCAGQGFELAD